MTSIALAAHPTHDDQRVAQVLNRALEGGPPNATHGNIPTLSQHNGVSKSTIHRWFQLFNRSPHRQRHFKISNNPYYVDKLQNILGLLPDHAVVLSCCRWDWTMGKESPMTPFVMARQPCSLPWLWPPATCW